jgi:hypothetical protein
MNATILPPNPRAGTLGQRLVGANLLTADELNSVLRLHESKGGSDW